jgi:hypothetical protein
VYKKVSHFNNEVSLMRGIFAGKFPLPFEQTQSFFDPGTSIIFRFFLQA